MDVWEFLMKAKDLMVPLSDHLRPETTLKDAAHMLKTAHRGESRIGVKALPVLDSQGSLVGILSIGDILKAVYPAYLYLMDLGEFAWDGMIESFAKKAAEKQVSDVMTRTVVTVREDATLMECVDHMLKSGVKRVPVMNSKHAVVGMLYERDVFYAITKSMVNKDAKERP